jgi:hypothetical protein
MAEMVKYEGQTGLMAIVTALETLRQLLEGSVITKEQAVGYVGCINLHLARSIGADEEKLGQLEECAGLLCPSCHAFVGFVSNLSGQCHLCGERFFPRAVSEG